MFGLELEIFGLGLAHMEATAECQECDHGRAGIAPWTIPCPTCRGTRVVPSLKGASREAV